MAPPGAGVIVRDFAPADALQVRDVVARAFPTAAEADLVEKLRADGDAAIELVADNGSEIVGHVMLSPLRAPHRALAVGPLAVVPPRQRQGIGSALMDAANARAREQGWPAIFLLGDPAYYGRFGYSVDAAAPYNSVYSGPHFMMLPLAGKQLPPGPVEYAPAFAALDQPSSA